MAILVVCWYLKKWNKIQEKLLKYIGYPLIKGTYQAFIIQNLDVLTLGYESMWPLEVLLQFN